MAEPGEWSVAVPIITSLLGVGTTIAAMSQRPSIPSFPQFQIPNEDLAAINQQIAGNTGLSNEARAAATQALSSYNAGQLSSAYAGQYQAVREQQLAAVKQQLAAQGFTEGSTQWQNAMNQFNLWDQNLKSQLLQSQLNDALKMSGLSDLAVSDYLNKWGAQTSAAGGAGSTASQQTLANIMNANLTSSQLGRAGTAIGNLSSVFATPNVQKGLSNLFTPSGKTSDLAGTTPTGWTSTEQTLAEAMA